MPQGSAHSFTATALIAPVAPEKPSDHRKWGQLAGCSDALAICESARDHKGLTLVITRSTDDAIRLEQAIRFFLNLPPEEDAELCLPAQAAGMNFIRLVTPTTDDKRLPRRQKPATTQRHTHTSTPRMPLH